MLARELVGVSLCNSRVIILFIHCISRGWGLGMLGIVEMSLIVLMYAYLNIWAGDIIDPKVLGYDTADVRAGTLRKLVENFWLWLLSKWWSVICLRLMVIDFPRGFQKLILPNKYFSPSSPYSPFVGSLDRYKIYIYQSRVSKFIFVAIGRPCSSHKELYRHSHPLPNSHIYRKRMKAGRV